MEYINFAIFGIDLSPESIFGGILVAARSLFYWISSLIYSFIPTLYNLFNDIANATFVDTDIYTVMVNRVGFLLGLIALLVVIFDFIKILINPDKMFDKDSGMLAVTKRIIIVLVILGASGFVFQGLYWFQGYILNNNIISKLIVPTSGKELNQEKFGNVLSAQTFLAFYKLNESNVNTNTDNYLTCVEYQNILVENIVEYNNYSAGNYCLNIIDSTITDVEKEDSFIIDYNFIVQIVVGIFLIWIFINYIIKVGVRAIQLGVLQIIAPFFIIGYLSPKKENLFTKWCKLYFATYLDLFIRCAIIFFVVFISSQLLDSLTNQSAADTFWNSVGEHGSSKTFIIIAMILALLTFAKNAPELIKQLLPEGSGTKLGFGLGLKDAFGLNVGAGVVGAAVASGAIGLLGGGPGGLVSGVLRGTAQGLKGQGISKSISGAYKSQKSANQRKAEWRAQGGGLLPFGRWRDSLDHFVGTETSGEKDSGILESLNNYAKIQEQIEATADNYSDVKNLKKRYETIQQGGRIDGETDDEFNNRVREAEKLWKDARKNFITESMNGQHGADNNADLIRAYQDQANRQLKDRSVFGNNFNKKINNFDELDQNTQAAKKKADSMKTERRYERRQANSKYSNK